MDATIDNIPKVLIVDDEPESMPIKKLKEFLKQKIQAVVDIAEDNFTFDKLIKKGVKKNEPYDFIVLDLKSDTNHNTYEFIDWIDALPEQYSSNEILGFSSFWGDLPPERMQQLNKKCYHHFHKTDSEELYKHILKQIAAKGHTKTITKNNPSTNTAQSGADPDNEPKRQKFQDANVDSISCSLKGQEPKVDALSKKNFLIGAATLLTTVLLSFFGLIFRLGQIDMKIDADKELRNQLLTNMTTIMASDCEARNQYLERLTTLIENDKEARNLALNRIQDLIEKDTIERKILFEKFDAEMKNDRELRVQTLEYIKSIAKNTQ